MKNPHDTATNKLLFIRAYTSLGEGSISKLNIKQACEVVGIGQRTFYDWKRDDPDFAEQLEAAQLEQIKQIEQHMFSRIAKGSDKLIEFYLKTKGKKEGYGEEKSDNNFTFKVTIAKDDEDTDDINSDDE